MANIERDADGSIIDWSLWKGALPSSLPKGWQLGYAADGHSGDGYLWRPSTHMPRWASRITRKVTRVSALRILDINDDELRGIGTTDPDNVDAAHRAMFEMYWSTDWPKYPYATNPWAWLYDVTQP